MRNLAIMAMILTLSACQPIQQETTFPRSAMYNDRGDLGFYACLSHTQQDTPILATLMYVDQAQEVQKGPVPLVRVGGVYNSEQDCRHFNFKIHPPADAQEVIRVELKYVKDGM